VEFWDIMMSAETSADKNRPGKKKRTKKIIRIGRPLKGLNLLFFTTIT